MLLAELLKDYNKYSIIINSFPIETSTADFVLSYEILYLHNRGAEH